ncbi:TA system VapC family ribonuclease toxin [Tahibacter soli]|jgi:toxin-antitoxin system PIN domain toxin|uniref:Ribonuclease VapC n=1 Tax=Tahibacter soli TaxID=2983605 RepID=A0A9X3YK64_9GAMM|nr:TA system VapC family ribonuclease toxin [Tahibacter soli]MDC8012466.1 PIN domain-containing protein [Tahibacter soli]
MRYIVDANVIFPVIAAGHAHHRPAVAWWDACADDDVGLCWPVRMALLRLLTNRKIMGSGVLRPEQAWSAVETIASDPRMVLIDQAPQSHHERWRTYVGGREPSPDLWTDAWLAALAHSLDTKMVTFDRGFLSFDALRLQLLTPTT